MGHESGPATPKRGSLLSLLAACAILAAVLAPLVGGLAWFAYGRSGQIGALAALTAGGVCFASASLALSTMFVCQRVGSPMAGILGSIAFRMGLPLAAGLAIDRLNQPLSEAGCFAMILGLYLVTLVVETMVSLNFVPQPRPKSVSDAAAAPGLAGH